MSYTCGRCLSVNHNPGPCECCGNGTPHSVGAAEIRINPETTSDVCECWGTSVMPNGRCMACGKKLRPYKIGR